MNYNKYRYIFPPRPKNAIPETELDFWDNGSLIGQPKLNGSNTSIYMNGTKNTIMNRHDQRLTNFQITQNELNKIFICDNGEWLVLNAEYMNKSKNDENNVVFNHNLVIFDILVYKSEYLVGTTFSERVDILDSIYGTVNSEKSYLYSITDNIYRVKSFTQGFKSLFDEWTKIDMVEGLVLKRANARLEIGNTENNNTKSQLKARKSTKNYKY